MRVIGLLDTHQLSPDFVELRLLTSSALTSHLPDFYRNSLMEVARAQQWSWFNVFCPYTKCFMDPSTGHTPVRVSFECNHVWSAGAAQHHGRRTVCPIVGCGASPKMGANKDDYPLRYVTNCLLRREAKVEQNEAWVEQLLAIDDNGAGAAMSERASSAVTPKRPGNKRKRPSGSSGESKRNGMKTFAAPPYLRPFL